MKKDTLYVILFVVVVVSVIGLLMAYSDGHLDGTILADAISVLLPALVSAFIGMVVAGYWWKKLNPSGPSGKGLLLSALLVFVTVLLLLLFGPETLLTPALYIGVGIVTITLIAFWITG